MADVRDDLHLSALGARDVDEAVAVHRRAFPGFFLSRLGPSVLRLFYEGFVDRVDTVAVAARDAGGTLLGTAVGPLEPDSFYGRLIRRRAVRFGLASLGFALRNPGEIPRIIRALRYRGGHRPEGPLALLSSISVDPAGQGRGVGRRLLAEWEARVRAAGRGGAYLSTDAIGNDATIGFYRSCGWIVESRFRTPEGREMVVFVRRWSTRT